MRGIVIHRVEIEPVFGAADYHRVLSGRLDIRGVEWTLVAYGDVFCITRSRIVSGRLLAVSLGVGERILDMIHVTSGGSRSLSFCITCQSLSMRTRIGQRCGVLPESLHIIR